MKNFIIVVLAIIVVVLVVGGVGAYTMLHDVVEDESALEKAADKVSNVASSDSDGNNIVSEEVKANAQNGEGFYREVTYKDGGFRQYDRDTGELIGSSYSSDQDKLPSME